ncbi:hypothetical protein V1478_012076 [Vespula squamosa]|uniref:Uncharacterized protein n=1 Tax=Vespula squamosa TaxID=30214 RepID=A0ABD2ACE4_VESSQ
MPASSRFYLNNGYYKNIFFKYLEARVSSMEREWKCLDHSGITKQSRLIRGLKDNSLAVKFGRPLL